MRPPRRFQTGTFRLRSRPRMPAEDLPECLNCGCCCFSQLADYVRVTGDDYARLGEHADAMVVFSGNRAYMRMQDGHCAALRLVSRHLAEPESDLSAVRVTTEYVCSVYALRPETCRELQRGADTCRAERFAKADRPQLLALRLSQTRPLT
jgi:uncharacterized protein